MNEIKEMLLREAMEAMRDNNRTGFEKAAYYDAETGSNLIKLYEDRLPLEEKCRIAVYHYSNHGDFYPTIRKYVRKARIIRPDNWRDELPSSEREKETFIVYRGGGETISKAPYCLSWTLSKEVAEWFMKRHERTHPGEQHLYRASIAADKAIAYIGGRNEFEIVQYRGVKGVEEIGLCRN